MKDDYQIGDKVWIYVNGHKGEKTEHEVVHIFERYGHKEYVCMRPVPGIGEELLEVRNRYTMSPAEDEGIGLFQAVRSSIKKSWRAEGKNFID